MQVMAWSLSTEEQAQVRDAFMLIDRDCQGTITLAELRKALVGRGQITDDLIEPIFRKLDTEQHQEVRYSEFLAAMVSTRIAVHDDLVAATFDRFDLDNRGFITVENLRDVLGDSFDGSRVEELLDEADMAARERISYEEFVHALGLDCVGATRSPRHRLLEQVLPCSPRPLKRSLSHGCSTDASDCNPALAEWDDDVCYSHRALFDRRTTSSVLWPVRALADVLAPCSSALCCSSPKSAAALRAGGRSRQRRGRGLE